MRATNAPASRERRRRRLELAKGFRGARSKLFRTATEAVDRAQRLATIHRKLYDANQTILYCFPAAKDPAGFKQIVEIAKKA